MAGINIINIYCTTIFENIAKNGGALSIAPKTESYFIGIMGFTGSCGGYFTLQYVSRKNLMLYGHVIMGICLILVAVFVTNNSGLGSLICMCLFVLTYQMTNGTVFWVYVAEVVTDSAMGFSVMILMVTLLIQSLGANAFIAAYGITNLFYILGGYQVLTILVVIVWMKETKGLSDEEKKGLYRANKGNQAK